MMSTPARERAFLDAHLDAAVDGGAGDRRVVREPVDLVLDLHGELARRRQDQDAALGGIGTRPDAVCYGPLGQQSLQDRHDERAGLAGAGFRARDEIAAAERQRDDRALNRPRGDPPEIADAFEQARIEVERREGNRRRIAHVGSERGHARC